MKKRSQKTQRRLTGKKAGRSLGDRRADRPEAASHFVVQENLVVDAALIPSPVTVPHSTRAWLWYIVTGATVILLIFFSMFVFKLTTTIELERQQLIASSRAYQELHARFVELRNESDRSEDFLRILSSPQIRITALEGFGFEPPASGTLFWIPDQHSGVLQVSNLPSVPEGKTYQLWLLGGKSPISAGVFSVRSGGSGFYRLDSLASFASGRATLAVTLEREGGAAKPSGIAYLKSSTRQH